LATDAEYVESYQKYKRFKADKLLYGWCCLNCGMRKVDPWKGKRAVQERVSRNAFYCRCNTRTEKRNQILITVNGSGEAGETCRE